MVLVGRRTPVIELQHQEPKVLVRFPGELLLGWDDSWTLTRFPLREPHEHFRSVHFAELSPDRRKLRMRRGAVLGQLPPPALRARGGGETLRPALVVDSLLVGSPLVLVVVVFKLLYREKADQRIQFILSIALSVRCLMFVAMVLFTAHGYFSFLGLVRKRRFRSRSAGVSWRLKKSEQSCGKSVDVSTEGTAGDG
jgi:hypothetical protein